MSRGALIYEGRGKQMHRSSSSADKCYVEFDDGATSYDGVERCEFQDKGTLRNHISTTLMEALEAESIPTFFQRSEGTRGMEVSALDTFPIEVVCRNMASGSFMRRLGLSEGEVIPFTVVEFMFRGSGPCAPPLRLSGLKEITTITEGDVKIMQSRSIMANKSLKSFLYDKGLVLAELRLEFGRTRDGRLKIGDEISPDTCRLWLRDDHEKIDRDRFMKELGTDEAGYRRAASLISK